MFRRWTVALTCFAMVGLTGWAFAEQKGLAVFQRADGTIEITGVKEGAPPPGTVGAIKADGVFFSGAPAALIEAKQGSLDLKSDPFGLDSGRPNPPQPEKHHFQYFYSSADGAATNQMYHGNAARTVETKLPPHLDASRELADLKALLLDVDLDRKHKELLLDVMVKMERMQTTLELTSRPTKETSRETPMFKFYGNEPGRDPSIPANEKEMEPKSPARGGF
jgi:hypothetical protein